MRAIMGGIANDDRIDAFDTKEGLYYLSETSCV